MRKTYFVYLLANRPNGTLYLGVTSDLVRRVWQHKNGHFTGFTSRYGIGRLVWFETHTDVHAAIAREKKMKKWPRAYKINLIEAENPRWDDLYDGLVQASDGAAWWDGVGWDEP